MHHPHPVHSEAITVCIRFAAPTMASTGQASRQSAQPMQAASSMKAMGDVDDGDVPPRDLETIPALYRQGLA